MALFNVIKCDMRNDVLVQRHECEDFNTKSQLIVQQAQEAVFFYDGQPQDVFGPGKYTLDTSNLPILSKYINKLTGGDSPFHAVVYFTNQVNIPDVKWGSAIKVPETVKGNETYFDIGARGGMTLHIENTRKLIEKLVGTETLLTRDAFTDKLLDYIIPVIKENFIAKKKENNISVFNLEGNLSALSKAISPSLAEQLDVYGVALENFSISGLRMPEDNPVYQNLLKLQSMAVTLDAESMSQDIDDLREERRLEREARREQMKIDLEAKRAVTLGQASAMAREAQGYSYQEKRQLDIAEAAAKNQASGQFMNMGMGLSMMNGIGSALGAQAAAVVNNAVSSLPQETPAAQEPAQKMIFCPECGSKIPKGKFCMECGYKFEIPSDQCRNCGNKLAPGAKFCMECGTPV